MKRLLLLFSFAAGLAAQPRAPEIYGNIGILRGAGDEGSYGSSAAYGGAVTVPFTRKLAVDLDVESARYHRSYQGDYWRVHRWLINPSVLYRWGNERLLGFVGVVGGIL